ncbi:MAG: alanine--tRNA ligase [Fidelibacterota bacterium]
MKARDIRQHFIDFFKERGHSFVRSSSLVPRDDPSLLVTNAGMNQFKNIFLEKEKPSHTRVVNSQKCIRVSGKHNDLEEVGLDGYHHTFFEMLGNWSFGDYYKEEAIRWAWDLLTEVWGLSKDRLWATVYEEDGEAEEFWRGVTDIDPRRILKFGKKDNFWEMGDTGPCGPSSEIHYYVGEHLSKQSRDGINTSDQYWELWNLVFIQYNRNDEGGLDDLPKKHVDTGAGLERLTAVIQGVTSDYGTDLFQPVIRKLEGISGTRFDDHPIAYRVISDHLRMLAFAIADGVMPSNEGRGYMARRILRRAARFGTELGCHDPFIFRLVGTVAGEMGDTYPELLERRQHIEHVVEAEEVSFNDTLDRGIDNFHKIASSLAGTVIPGVAAFRLYDTFGFPVDLTEQMAKEKGLTVDMAGFHEAMEEQRKRTRSLAKFKLDSSEGDWVHLTEGEDSEFLGYTDLTSDSTIRRYQQSDGNVLLILDQTPFYAEQGGQMGDTGYLVGDGFKIRVTDTVKEGHHHVHVGKLTEGKAISSEKVEGKVDVRRRQKIRLNHTATHLLHKALKLVLGEHVQQAGSLVAPDYLRFDLTHYQKIRRDEIAEIEKIVNREIQKNTPLDITVKDYDTARKQGAVAIFEEKYGDKVRVIAIGDFSRELCGGTHVDRTGDIGFFKIVEESALAAGVRRIVAVTGPGAVDYVVKEFESVSKLQDLLNCSKDEVVDRVEKLLDQRKSMEKQLRDRRTLDGGAQVAEILKKGKKVGDRQVVISKVQVHDLEQLKVMGDQVVELLKSGVGVLLARIDSKPSLVCVVTGDLIEEGIKANKLARSFGEKLGGGGGGKARLATAGGKNGRDLDEIVDEIEEDLLGLLEGNDA